MSEFEIDMTTPDNKTLAVYRGRDTECVVASLLPGRPYLFQVIILNSFFASCRSNKNYIQCDQKKSPNVYKSCPKIISIEK